MRPALLFGISLQDLETEDSGIVVILEGMVEAMAMTRQACRSYLANEILWGHRFELVLFKEKNQYKIDYSHFHKMSEVPSTSCCSARDLVENKFLLPKHQLLLLQELAAFLSHEEEDEVDGEQDSLSSQATCNFDRPQAGTALVLTDGSLRSELLLISCLEWPGAPPLRPVHLPGSHWTAQATDSAGGPLRAAFRLSPRADLCFQTPLSAFCLLCVYLFFVLKTKIVSLFSALEAGGQVDEL